MEIAFRIGTKYGVYAMLLGLIISILFYILNPGLLMNWAAYLPSLVTIILMVMAVKECRNYLGGHISMREGWLTGWSAYLFPAVISTLLTWLLFNYIDPSLLDLQREKAIEAAIRMAEAFGMSADDQEKMMSSLENADMSLTMGRAMMSLVFSLLLGGIIAAIIALIMKREKPKDSQML